MIRIEVIWLAHGASDLRGGMDILLAQVLRGFADGATKPVTTSQPSSTRACQGVTRRKRPPSFSGAPFPTIGHERKID